MASCSPLRLGLVLTLWLVGCTNAEQAPKARSPAAIAQISPLPGLKLRPLTDRTFERTEARRARGEYLAEGILACAACHSERDWTQPGGPVAPGRAYAGVVWKHEGKTWLVAPNITPEPYTGAGRWSDDMLARAIREGIGHDGRLLHPQMWYRSYRQMSDEDLASVVVYLRSLPPVRNTLPQTVLSEEQSSGSSASRGRSRRRSPRLRRTRRSSVVVTWQGLPTAAAATRSGTASGCPVPTPAATKWGALVAWCSAPTSPPTPR